MLLFETPRLLIRQVEPTDLDQWAALCGDEIAMRYVGDGMPLPRSDVARWIEVCQEKYRTIGFGTSAIIEKSSEQFIGYCGVVRPPEQEVFEIIYGLVQSAWGKGYATEAAQGMLHYIFTHFQLDTIYASIHAANHPSRHIMDKLGFVWVRDQVEDDDSVTVWYKLDR